jgi:hypothetical protein
VFKVTGFAVLQCQYPYHMVASATAHRNMKPISGHS